MRFSAFLKLVQGQIGYHPENKKKFHREAGKLLLALAKALDYKPEDYDLRHNQGGIAVSGEITLHSDTLYCQLSQSALGPGFGFMWRTCKHRKDYTGGPNQWARWESLENPEALARTMKGQVAREALAPLGL